MLMGAMTACLALAACGSSGGRAEPGQTGEGQPGTGQPVQVDGDGQVLLQCWGQPPSFPPGAWESGELVEDEIRQAVLAAAELIDAADVQDLGGPDSLSVADADIRLLGREVVDGADTVLVALGRWDIRPEAQAPAMWLRWDEAEQEWRFWSGSSCDLRPSLGPGHSWVTLAAEPASLRRDTTELQLQVREIECTSARDPLPHLNQPVVQESNTSVTVWLTAASATGDQNCPGNPWGPLTISLEQPLGDRELLDGSQWPPTPVEPPQE